jgi:hypothetical protein
MTHEQRDLILAALGLRPYMKGRKLHRWSFLNGHRAMSDEIADWRAMELAGWVERLAAPHIEGAIFAVTRAGAEAAGVLGRCRREDVGR